jgi:hypothetical protein
LLTHKRRQLDSDHSNGRGREAVVADKEKLIKIGAKVVSQAVK